MLEAAKELDYQPNHMARQLQRADTFVIGVILGQELGTISPFVLKEYESIKIELERRGYSTKRVKFSSEGELLTVAKTYLGIGLNHTDPRYLKVLERDTPYVSVGDVREGHFWVASNDGQGGYLATKHLLDNGCRTIYYVCLHIKQTVSGMRHCGYRKALIEASLIPS